jgi:hypothetical protein
MNTADERLRAAARTAMDMFPPGGELPPLRLPAPPRDPRGAARRHTPAVTGHLRAWLAPLAAAAAVMAVIAGVVLPHEFANGPASPQPARHKPPAPYSATQQKQRALDALAVEAAAPATGMQYDRGGQLTWMLQALELRAQARCMARLGYHISVTLPPFNLGDFADNTQMPDLPRIARTHQFVNSGGLVGPAYSAAEQKALNGTCRAPVAAYRSLLNAYQAINNAWWQIIFRVQASRQVRAAIPALNACATRYGFPNSPYGNATAPIKTFPDFMDWVAGFLDGAGSRGASASTMSALARHWTAVFVTCATPIVDIWQRMLARAQPGFLHQHARQIAQLDQQAWRILSQADGVFRLR